MQVRSCEEPFIWRKSSYSSGGTGDCVEVASSSHGVVVRDSKNPEGGTLTFTSREWAVFLQSVKAGESIR